MEGKEERSNQDSLLFQYLINILNDFYKEDEVQKEDISVINYIIEYGHLPFKYRFKDMMRVFSLEYSITDNTELDILNLKNKWVDRIIKNTYTEHKFAGSDIIEDPQNAFIILEDHIKHLNEIGVELVRDKLLKAFSMDDKVVKGLEFYNDTPNSKTILVCIYKFKNELFGYILNELNENVYKPNFFKNLEDSIVSETLNSERGVYEKKYGFIPTLRGFGMYLISTMPQIIAEDVPAQIEVLLADYVIDKLDNIDNNIEKAKAQKQTLIDITPQQTLSIDTTSAHVEEGKEERAFNDLFPSIEDKEMVMKMLVGLKIINSEGKYLLGSKRGIIRVFIDVMKEEGYFIDIDRKPILRIFTPVILNKLVEKINKPLDSDVMERRIIKKLSELRK